MTLSESARTGRKFRRTSEPEIWYWLEGNQMIREKPGQWQIITAEMLIALDWQPEPLKLELTAADIIRAARQFDSLASTRKLSAAEFGKMICQELGLLEGG